VTGNRLWQRLGSDDSTKVTFGYYGDGLLYSVTPPGGNPEVVTYDPVRRNVQTVTAANGAITTHYSDAVGRDTMVTTPTTASKLQRSKIKYDIMDRVWITSTFGPQDTLGSSIALADSFVVTNTYDFEGNLTAVARSRGIHHPGELYSTFSYNEANMLASQTQSGRTESFSFDLAGNVTAHNTPLGSTYFKYDAAGRLVRRLVPQKTYQSEACDPAHAPCYYSFPTTGAGSVCIPADTAYFHYDAAGRVVGADNIHSKVRRGYNPRGAITHDTLRIRSYHSAGSSPCELSPDGVAPTSEWTIHVYPLSYHYHLDGKRGQLVHPSGSATYTYNANTGWLANVSDAGYATVAFNYDGQGRVRNVFYPGGVNDARSYTGDGRLTLRAVNSGSTLLFWDTYTYDPMDRITSVYNAYKRGMLSGALASTWYTGLGAVGEVSDHNQQTSWPEKYRVDALGNRIRRELPGARPGGHPDYAGLRFSSYDVHGRVTAVTDSVISGYDPYHLEETYSYEAGQNHRRTRYEWVAGQSVTLEQTRMYYGIENRLRVLNNHVGISVGPSNQGTLYEEHRYDALGRRILVRARRPNGCDENVHGNLGCASYVERTVWDGDQILLERRTSGGYGKNAWQLDNETPSTPAFGRVVSLLPLGVLGVDGAVGFRKEIPNTGWVWIAAHKNWRAQYELGTDVNGVPSTQWSGLPLEWLGAATTLDGSKNLHVPLAHWWGSLLSNKEDASGLNYMRNRYYDPKTGIFTQIDPIGIAGGLNLYGYANGDPVNFSDPYGLCARPGRPCPPIRPGLFGGAASQAVTPVQVRVSGSLGLPTGSCSVREGCQLGGVNLTPQYGASVDIGLKFRSAPAGEPIPTVSYGFHKHASAYLSTEEVGVSAGFGVGSAFNVTVDPNGKESETQAVESPPPVAPDATRVAPRQQPQQR
jgi:RHS repeat-associated protein